MATVPGDPNEPSNVTPMLPKQFQPTMADFLQAAAIMDQKGRFQTAMDISGMRRSTNIEDRRANPTLDYTGEEGPWKRWMARKAYATQPKRPEDVMPTQGDLPLSRGP